ncbi:uncharacterized protein BDV14DRAFT_211644 [Aspergillus stella-maris]|uniref:uncharacterized protein n=1 Tax=Aspergillus stella-maris TaxID=1810926 RepID=UPI003CCE0B9A
MVRFPDLGGYVAKETNADFFDDGREIELLHFVYEHPDLESIRNSPERVLDAIDEYGRTKKYLMNVGQEKGQIVCDLIADVKPNTMVELGGYIGYSAIMFGNAVRKASGGNARYYSIEKNPIFAAVSMALVGLAGLSDAVKVVVGSGSEGIMRLHVDSVLDKIDLLFLDHYKPAYVTDLKLCEQLRLIAPKSVIAADNVIYPGNPPYLKYVRSSVDEKRNGLELEELAVSKTMPKESVDQYVKRYGVMATGQYTGNPNLMYMSKLVEGAEPTGEPMDSLNIGTMLKSTGLISLSFFLLPYTATITLACLILSRHTEYKWFKLYPPPLRRGPEKTILVTGISMTKGLVIARLLAKHATKTRARYRIIGADIEPVPFTSPGRYTRAISEFYRLDGGSSFHYKRSLLEIIRNERVNLWISCSGVVHEVDDGSVAELAKARADSEPDGHLFHAIQFPERIVERLHCKDSFIQYIASLGLPHPISHLCTSAGQVECLLSHYAGENNQRVKVAKAQRSFILKPLGVDDKKRDEFLNSASLLPLATPEETRAYLSRQELAHSITPDSPILLQEFIRGPEYATHALVVNGTLQAFTAVKSSSMLMHYTALPPTTPAYTQMEDFTNKIISALVEEFGAQAVNGHLSFDFIQRQVGEGFVVDDMDEEAGLYAIECNPRVHTAVVLFSEDWGVAGRYLSAMEGDETEPRPTPHAPKSYHWTGHNLVMFLIYPPLTLKRAAFWASFLDFEFEGKESWDAVWDFWDPVPFFVLYHLYWPVRFLEAVVEGRGWTRVNVSTGKMFET